MPLTCVCDDDCDYYAEPMDEFEELGSIKGRCQSCRKNLNKEEYILRFRCFEIEDDEDKELPYEFLCESCGEIYSNLQELDFCVTIREDLQEAMHEYRAEYLAAV